MIGDDFKSDVQGATQLNIPAFWINHKNKKKEMLNDLIVELKQFKELLGYLA